MIGGPPGFPRIPGASDDIAVPHKFEKVVRLVKPFTPSMLEKACASVGFTKPAQAFLAGIAGTERWETRSAKSFGSRGETIEVEIVSPHEVVLRSASRLPAVPFFDWKKNSDNVEKLARALGAY